MHYNGFLNLEIIRLESTEVPFSWLDEPIKSIFELSLLPI